MLVSNSSLHLLQALNNYVAISHSHVIIISHSVKKLLIKNPHISSHIKTYLLKTSETLNINKGSLGFNFFITLELRKNIILNTYFLSFMTLKTHRC